MADEDPTIEDILEACNATPSSLAGDTLVGGVSSDFSSLAGEYLDTPPNVIKPRREIIQDQWNKIAHEAGAAGIEFVNEVDDEEVPPGIGILFPYVERSYLFDIGTAESTALAGCECDGKSGCNNARPGRCPCASASSTLKNGPAYTQLRLNLIYRHTLQGIHTCLDFQGLFAFTTESEIVECNSACGCSPQCNNRLAQFPRQIPAQIFKTEKRGWGARLPVDIVRGQVVGLYTGLLIRREEADKLSGSRASYCFDLDVNEGPDEETPENAYSVDAYGCGNWTRFINHSCSPNLQIISVVYDAMPEVSLLRIHMTSILFERSRVNLFLEDNMPYLALVATENIPAFTELTFDYNPAHQTEWELKRYREKTRSKKNKSKKQTRSAASTRPPSRARGASCGARQMYAWLRDRIPAQDTDTVRTYADPCSFGTSLPSSHQLPAHAQAPPGVSTFQAVLAPPRMSCPASVVVVRQRVCMAAGSLLDQIIYRTSDFAQTGMAHVLYHRPKLAVFDAGITLIMRLSLAKYHMVLLTLADDGSARVDTHVRGDRGLSLIKAGRLGGAAGGRASGEENSCGAEEGSSGRRLGSVVEIVNDILNKRGIAVEAAVLPGHSEGSPDVADPIDFDTAEALQIMSDVAQAAGQSAPLNDPSVHGTHDSEHLPAVGVQRFMAAPLDAASDMYDGVVRGSPTGDRAQGQSLDG
ncbi:hypothetical protein C8J57DRAFT_1527999 [Mycena rebaudengoi]|nr:hypothetical protein C8J57DRAFT_1527999 [Mycena rebaudengoi]